MRCVWITTLLLLFGCTSRLVREPTIQGHPMAYDSIAKGNVNGSAAKWEDKEELCFDISVSIKGGEEEHILPANWSLAWVDKNQKFHLLKLTQRDPASVPHGGQVLAPYGSYEEWTNSFRNCVPRLKMKDVKALVLTPKSLPFKDAGSLNLKWDK